MIFKITLASVSVGMTSAVMLPELPVLSPEEKEKLLIDLNQFCEPYGIVFFRSCFDFVGADLRVRPIQQGGHTGPPLRVSCTNFRKACGRPLGSFLPTGSDGVKLNAWMTEIQMFLHQHSINQIRRERGDQTLDILWFEKVSFFKNLLIWTKKLCNPK